MAEKTQLAERYLAAKRKLFDTYYSELNDPQREAVFTANGSLLVLAGAGSGKTTVLVKRIVFLVKYGNAYLSEYVPHDLSEQKVTELSKGCDRGNIARVHLSAMRTVANAGDNLY